MKSQNGSYQSDRRGEALYALNVATEFFIFCIISDSKHSLWASVSDSILSRGEYILNAQFLSFSFSYLRVCTKSSSFSPKSPAALKLLLGFLISVSSMQICLWRQQIN